MEHALLAVGFSVFLLLATCASGADAAASAPGWEAYRRGVLPGPTAVREIGNDVFVHVRIPYDPNRDRIRLKEAEARSTETEALLSFLLEKALARERERNPPPPEVAWVSELVLRFRPAWKSAGLSVSTGTIPSKAGPEETGDGSLCTVRWFDKADLDHAVELAVVEWGGAEFWAKALETVIAERWVQRTDASFLAAIGAPDAAWLAGAEGSLLDAASFVPSRSFGPAESGDADVPEGTPKDAAAEFAALRRELRAWLRSPDSAAADLVRTADAILGPTIRTNMVVEGPFVRETTNVVVSVVTNRIDAVGDPVVGKRHSSGESGRPMPWRGEWRTGSLRTEGISVTTNVATTILRSNEFRRVPEVVSETGTPAFEVAFLSAGERIPDPKPKTAAGSAAEMAFKETTAFDARRRALENGLRENPGDPDLWNFLGRLYQDAGEHLGAIVCFRCALRLNRLHPYATVNMATSCAAAGKPALARGFAALARGLAKDDWCRTRAEVILFQSNTTCPAAHNKLNHHE